RVDVDAERAQNFLGHFRDLPSRWYKATLMCALCGVLLNDHWAEQEGGRRGRTFRVGLVNRVLEHFGLHLDDWSGRVYVLRDRKGRSAVVENLGALWSQAELLAGRPLDPLDPELVRPLGRQDAGGAHHRFPRERQDDA